MKYQIACQTKLINEDEVEYLFGHSLGEYTGIFSISWIDYPLALVAAKSLDPLEVVKILQIRGSLMQKYCEGKEGLRKKINTN